jgi:hypothetical protein
MSDTPPNRIVKGTPNNSGSGPPELPSIEHLLFKAPLYAEFSVTMAHMEVLYAHVNRGGRYYKGKIDGYCLHCKQDATFTVDGVYIPGGDPWDKIAQRYAFDEMNVTCARNEYHSVRYFFRVRSMTISKVGQFPSLADIAIDETRQKFRSVLRGDNWSELYKAIGLAAHGEGIGSFVYLRRVFERLIHSRFDEFKAQEQWDESAFKLLRMDDKIGFLKDHLPRSLVETRKIYKIFSLGIHELDNETCLQFFEVGKRSIIMILEDDLKTQQELADRKQLAEAVAKFDTASDSADETPIAAEAASDKSDR